MARDRDDNSDDNNDVTIIARQSGWEPRVNQDENRRPGGVMIVSGRGFLQAD